jgi:hypothetical protein
LPNVSLKFSSNFFLENDFKSQEFHEHFESVKNHFKQQFELLQNDQKTPKLINLLLSIEDRYLPNIRGQFVSGGFGANMDEFMAKWFDWKENFNCQEVLESRLFN